YSGVVRQIVVAVGDNLQEGQAILVVEEVMAEVKAVAPKAAAAPVGKKVTAPLPGKVLEVCVKEGDSVKSGQKIAVLEAMKMENDIVSDYSGTVKEIAVAEGDTLQEGDTIFVVE
ncbi:MAG: biotin/lipoyl-binding protein, partial [Tidjanibacter sp.]|nr:biotin/lipoyl-binding protein [Tidjanibacter sp.]